MNFINPGILIGLIAASIPLLIHFLNRSRSRNIPFSTLSFLKELQQQKIKRLKIKQLLLLIIRTLIILLLVLAFARPTLQGTLSGVLESNAKSSLAVILDNSYSMNAVAETQSLLDRAKIKAEALVASIQQGDNAYFVSVTDTSQALEGGKRPGEFISEKIESLQPGYKTGNLSAAIQKAHSLLQQSRDVNKEIYIFSDLQSFTIAQDTVSIHDASVNAFAIPVRSSSIHNIGIKNLNIISTMLEKEKLVELQVEFFNSGKHATENTLAELFVNDEKAAQTLLQLQPNVSAVETFKFVLNKAGFINGCVKLEDDDLAMDNNRYFSIYVPEQIKAGLVYTNPKDADLLTMALNPRYVEMNRFALDMINSSDFSTSRISGYDVLVLVDIMTVPNNMVDKIYTFVQNGGGLVLVLGPHTDIQAFNRFLAQLRLPNIKSSIGNSISTEYTSFSLGAMDFSHPLFYGMFENVNTDFDKPRFGYANVMDVNQSFERIFDFSTGDPYLFKKTLGEGTILVLTSGLQPDITDLSRRTLFAPLMNRIVQYAGSKYKTDSLSTMVGGVLRTLLAVEHVQEKLEIKRPDGSFDRIEPVVHASGPRVEYTETNEPGIYELLANNQTLWNWAVNTDSRESDLEPVDEKEMESRFGVKFVDENADISTFMYQNRYGVELWFYFVLAALVLIVIEMLLFKSRSSLEE